MVKGDPGLSQVGSAWRLDLLLGSWEPGGLES